METEERVKRKNTVSSVTDQLVEFLVLLWCEEMLKKKYRRKSCATADVFYPCRKANLPLVIALCPPVFHCVPLKSPSKCGRQRLAGVSALHLPSRAHCVRFAGCLCCFFLLFFLLFAPRLYQVLCSSLLCICVCLNINHLLPLASVGFFFSLLFMPSLRINIVPQRK